MGVGIEPQVTQDVTINPYTLNDDVSYLVGFSYAAGGMTVAGTPLTFLNPAYDFVNLQNFQFASTGGSSQTATLTLDLGKILSLRSIMFYFSTQAVAGAAVTTLSMSSDGATWTTLETYSEGTGVEKFVNFIHGDKSCRYLRFTFVDGGSGGFIRFKAGQLKLSSVQKFY